MRTHVAVPTLADAIRDRRVHSTELELTAQKKPATTPIVAQDAKTEPEQCPTVGPQSCIVDITIIRRTLLDWGCSPRG